MDEPESFLIPLEDVLAAKAAKQTPQNNIHMVIVGVGPEIVAFATHEVLFDPVGNDIVHFHGAVGMPLSLPSSGGMPSRRDPFRDDFLTDILSVPLLQKAGPDEKHGNRFWVGLNQAPRSPRKRR